MDPITAFQVASSVITFVEFGVKLVHVIRESKTSPEGISEENKLRAAVNRSMHPIVDAISILKPSAIPEDERPLYNLALECKECCKQMDDLLDRLRAKGPGRLDKFRSTLKAFSSEPELKKLEERLGKCRLQISAHQIQIQGKRLTEFYQGLHTQSNNGLKMVETMQQHINQIRADIIKLPSKTSQDQLSLVLRCHEEALGPICANLIQKSLKFSNIDHRYNSIDNPKESTFSWIFDEIRCPGPAQRSSSNNEVSIHIEKSTSISPKEQEKLDQARKKFIAWLSSSDGIFHLTGVPGAGKSTMMKFMYGQSATKCELQKWAGNRKLCLAKHFFWRPGSDLQHNLVGLFYSLLSDIFKNCPELIPDTMPEYWEKAHQMSILASAEIEIPSDTVQHALLSLIQDQHLTKYHCFCFFIDGLDEFVGTNQQDYTSLANLLTDWVHKSNGNLKICVSSREENAFMNAFPKDQRLPLHDLTWYDISAYAREGLQYLEANEFKEKLIHKICDQSRGIFLWVILVVREIRDKIESGEENPVEIEATLSIPEGLEDLVVYILHNLNLAKRKKLSQVMAMLLLGKPDQYVYSFGQQAPVTQLAFSFLDEYNANEEFAIQTSFDQSSNISGIEERLERAEKQLRHCSGGFLKTTPNEEIDFIHRSIPELLGSEKLNHLLENVGPAKATKTLSHLTLAQVRTGLYNEDQATHILAPVVMLCLSDLDKSIHSFLAYIDSYIKDTYHKDSLHELDLPPDPELRLPLGPLRAGKGVWLFCGRFVYSPLKLRGSIYSAVNIFDTLYYAAITGNIEYAKFRAEKNPRILNDPRKRAFLIELVLKGCGPAISSWNSLLDGELLKEDINIHYISDGDITYEDPQPPDTINIWKWYLIHVFFYQALFVPDHSMWLNRHAHALEWFLTYKPAPSFKVKIDCKSLSDSKIWVFLDNARLTFRLRLAQETADEWTGWRRSLLNGETISLKQWITQLAPDNLEKLLNLIDTSAKSDDSHFSNNQSGNSQFENNSLFSISVKQSGLADMRPEKNENLDLKQGQKSTYMNFRATIILALAISVLISWILIRLPQM